jgi:hypothetical protein
MMLRPGLVVAVLCVASLLDAPWVRTAEQTLAPVLLVAEGLVADLMPSVEPFAAEDAEPAAAGLAWEAWLDAVAARPAVAEAGRQACVVPVIESLPERQELILRVPDGELLRDSPVTHRGVLVGFLRPWSGSDDRVVVAGRARVALLGHPRARPVAATLSDESLHFLVASRDELPTVVLRSRRVQPLPGQLAYSRDASFLGDSLPAGLAIGRVSRNESDLPGGALASQARDEPALEALLDAAELSHVTVEAPLQAELSLPVVEGHLLRSAQGRHRWQLDRGLLHGVGRGDGVVQQGRWVGRIEWAGPLTSIVSREVPAGPLIVGDATGQLVPVGVSFGAWPADWRPEPGLPVFWGNARNGGLSVGRLGPMDQDCLTIDLGGFDPIRPVSVLAR